ncbi:MAG TPA: MBL fold metallo-hydrolase [Phototrophicaceae bacterium]|nr:MBL fold metallo-hydrolase [Phototrophicaceae bacterium]
MIEQIQWLGHGSFFIPGPPLIYINPWRVARNTFHADVILVSHNHYDHCSLADISKLRGAETLVIGNEQVANEIEGCQILRPWQSIAVDRASIKAVPAYSPTSWQHPLGDGGLGFIISLNYFDIYYAGDTQIIPEMDSIRPDIAILPIDGNGTLTVNDAVEVVKQMRPRWVIPSNWGPLTEGASELDAKQFKREVGERAEVIIPNTPTRLSAVDKD